MQRKQARENAFMLIFESVCKKDETAEEIFTKATELRGLEYDGYVTDVFFGAYENADVIDERMEKHLKEAIELAKKFDDEKSYSFVNGVLNAMAQELSENEK